MSQKIDKKISELKAMWGEVTPLVVEKDYQKLYATPTSGPEKRAVSISESLSKILMLPLQVIFAPITIPLGLVATRLLTVNREFIDKKRHNPMVTSSDKNGNWEYLAIFASENATKAIEVNAYELSPEYNKNPKKLHINIHGLGGNANQFNKVTVPTAEKFAADQWNVTRNATWTVAGQKRQIRVLIAAAIQKGYEDIRLDGYSYGAGLVLNVYHELMQDEAYRNYFEANNITLHYTARNGYESEGLTVVSRLIGYGNKTDPNYINGTGKAPKPPLLMQFFSWVGHHLPLLNLTSLRTKPIKGLPIPTNSRNYVVNCVVTTKVTNSHGKIETRLKRDGVIGVLNSTNNIKEFGHNRIALAIDSIIIRDLIIKKISKIVSMIAELKDHDSVLAKLNLLLNECKDDELKFDALLIELEKFFTELRKQLFVKLMASDTSSISKLEEDIIDKLSELGRIGLFEVCSFKAFLNNPAYCHMVSLKVPELFNQVNERILEDQQLEIKEAENKIVSKTLDALEKYILNTDWKPNNKKWQFLGGERLCEPGVQTPKWIPSTPLKQVYAIREFQRENAKENNPSAALKTWLAVKAMGENAAEKTGRNRSAESEAYYQLFKVERPFEKIQAILELESQEESSQNSCR